MLLISITHHHLVLLRHVLPQDRVNWFPAQPLLRLVVVAKVMLVVDRATSAAVILILLRVILVAAVTVAEQTAAATAAAAAQEMVVAETEAVMAVVDKAKYDELWEWGRHYADHHCIIRRDKDHMLPGLPYGKNYRWQFYPRRGLYQPEFLRAVIQMFVYKVEQEIGHFNFQMCGVESAATPILCGAMLLNNIHVFSCRKEQKPYGLMNWLEGLPDPNLPVMLCDDLCNSTMSMKKAYTHCKEENLRIMPFAFSVFNKVNKGVHAQSRQTTDMYIPSWIKMLYIYDLDDFKLANPSH